MVLQNSVTLISGKEQCKGDGLGPSRGWLLLSWWLVVVDRKPTRVCVVVPEMLVCNLKRGEWTVGIVVEAFSIGPVLEFVGPLPFCVLMELAVCVCTHVTPFHPNTTTLSGSVKGFLNFTLQTETLYKSDILRLFCLCHHRTCKLLSYL